MTREIDKPAEGFSTLAAQFTRADVERIVATVHKLRERGRSEEEILGMMKRELASYSVHTIGVLYAMSTGKPIEDDVDAETIEHEEQVKDGTVHLRVAGSNPHLRPGELVRHRGATWYVATVGDKGAVLKSLG